MAKLKSFFASILMVVIVFATYAIPTAVLTTFSLDASAAECTLYETIHPNFPLTGAHLSTGKCSTCASCHAGGRFIGTPKVCATCHNGSPTSATVGRSTSHIPIGTTDCGSCHATVTFTSGVKMNHASVSTQRCDSCHNNAFRSYGAQGKPSDHIPTTADCGTCHKNTGSNWNSSFAAIHAGITTGCVTCHNGTTAKGKINAPGGHPITSNSCETCHSVNSSISFKCTQLINDPRIQKMLQGEFFAINYRATRKLI